MKLSEAIRVGSKLRPQGRVSCFRRNDEGQFYSCVLGAAYEAVKGYKEGDYVCVNDVEDLFPEIPNTPVHTVNGHFRDTFFSAIWYMNDIEGLSREEIADWVESKGY